MKKNLNKLKKYDRFLRIKRFLDGTIKIYRQSPFNSQKSYEILSIQNQYFGRWVLKKIMLMDHQRFNIIGKVHANNKAIRDKKEDDRVTREIADFIQAGGESIIL